MATTHTNTNPKQHTNQPTPTKKGGVFTIGERARRNPETLLI